MPSRLAESGNPASPGLAHASLPGSSLSSPLPEEQARADLYALVARLLIAAPDAGLLASLAAADSLDCEGADQPLDLAWENLVISADIMDVHAVRMEFNDLFISTGTPQVNPYASLYLSGFLNEKPLAALRDELVQLGLGRMPGVGEMEDHLAVLCEIMRVLIAGADGLAPWPLARQKLFFEKHIASWSSRCLDDIRGIDGANFYRRLADFAQAFFAVEAKAFEMELAEETAGVGE